MYNNPYGSCGRQVLLTAVSTMALHGLIRGVLSRKSGRSRRGSCNSSRSSEGADFEWSKRCEKRCTVISLAVVSSGSGSTPGGRTGGVFGTESDIPYNMWREREQGFRSDSKYILPGLSFFGSPFLWKSQETGLVVSLRSLVALLARVGLDDSN